MNKNNIIHESDEGYVVFDENESWFYFFNKDESLINRLQPIGLYRPGNFDLTVEEMDSIRKWLMENLKYGIFQS